MSAARSIRLAACLWSVAGVVYFVTEALAASRYPGYSYSVDYISALGVPRVSPSALVMNLGAFIVHGILFAAAGVVAATAMPRKSGARTAFIVLAVTNGVGNVLVGLFHAGDSSLHGLGALLAIVGGNAAMIVAGGLFGEIGAPQTYRVASRIAGVIGIGCFIWLLAVANLDTMPEGAIERGAVYTIIIWDLVTGVVLWAVARTHEDRDAPRTGTLGS